MKADDIRANRDADGPADANREFLTAVTRAVARRVIQKQAEENDQKRGENDGQPERAR